MTQIDSSFFVISNENKCSDRSMEVKLLAHLGNNDSRLANKQTDRRGHKKVILVKIIFFSYKNIQRSIHSCCTPFRDMLLYIMHPHREICIVIFKKKGLKISLQSGFSTYKNIFFLEINVKRRFC